MLVRVHASLSQDWHVPLEFFDLVQIVDEGLRHLFNQKGSVCNVELDLGFDLVVGLLKRAQFFPLAIHGLLTHLGKGLWVWYECGTALDTLLKPVLLDVPLNLFLESFLFLCFLFFHDFPSLFDHRIMLKSSSWLFGLLISLTKMMCWTCSLSLLQCRIDDLVLLIHENS